jgi:Copper amine oxidase, enzyme domain
MPPLAEEQQPTGEVQRTLYVGLLPENGTETSIAHQIVAVNLIQRSVKTYERHHPDLTLAADRVCGIPAFNCPIPNRGTPGQLWISWPAHNPLWHFLAIRPAASSGTRGSGLELRYVDYRGKRLLYQAHVPILNVLYDQNACGPYRDWQYAEHCLQCDGMDVAPGFRYCTSQPKTICESGNDQGNFSGVAIHDTGDELVLETVMTAGWYRYIQEWRFHRNGTITPRFKFAGTSSSCVCNVHNHHCYWRFDFDLHTPGNNLVEEYNSLPLIAHSNWHSQRFEIKRHRDYILHRKWRVRNTQSGEICEIIPGASDGVADTYGRGDLWVVRYHPNEIDDGYNNTTGSGTEANIDKFVNGEMVENQDVVVWYGAHFRHDVGAHGNECHTVGPILKLVHW